MTSTARLREALKEWVDWWICAPAGPMPLRMPPPFDKSRALLALPPAEEAKPCRFEYGMCQEHQSRQWVETADYCEEVAVNRKPASAEGAGIRRGYYRNSPDCQG